MSEQVVVIGAGPAGVSVALSLKDRGVSPLLVDRADQIASSWRSRYDRLKLNTGRQFSHLPNRKYPKGTPVFPTRDQVVAHIEGHAREGGIEADHVTLAIENPHTEVQLLSYRHPEMIADADTAKLNKVGFNHVCFAVDNLEAEVAKLTAAGVKVRNHMMDFHDRKLVFVYGPEDVTVELAQWH